MKKKLALVAAPVVLLAASAAIAENHWGLTPYVGVDAEFRRMDFQKGFGQNVIKRAAPQGNVYVGVRLNDYLGVEVGAEATERKTRTSTLKDGDILGGFTLPNPNAPDRDEYGFNTTSQTKGLHANLVGFFPICDLYRLQLIGMVGFARLKTKTILTFTTLNGGAVGPILGAGNDISTFKAKKSVLRLGAGLQHMINCNWGIRGMVKWEASKKLKASYTNPVFDNGNPATFSLKPKNSFIYSVGAFYTF